jgi:hypothetical protein
MFDSRVRRKAALFRRDSLLQASVLQHASAKKHNRAIGFSEAADADRTPGLVELPLDDATLTCE